MVRSGYSSKSAQDLLNEAQSANPPRERDYSCLPSDYDEELIGTATRALEHFIGDW